MKRGPYEAVALVISAGIAYAAINDTLETNTQPTISDEQKQAFAASYRKNIMEFLSLCEKNKVVSTWQ